MSLYFPLKVGRETVGAFEAQRMVTIPELGKPITDPDAVHTYSITIWDEDDCREMFTVEHRYGDGAWALVQKALAKSVKSKGEPT